MFLFNDFRYHHHHHPSFAVARKHGSCDERPSDRSCFSTFPIPPTGDTNGKKEEQINLSSNNHDIKLFHVCKFILIIELV